MNSPSSEADLRRYGALLHLADLMVHHGSLEELFPKLARRLQQVIHFEFANFSLSQAESHTMKLHVWQGGETSSIFGEFPVQDVASGEVWRNQEPLLFEDIRTESRFRAIFDALQEKGLRSYCLLPMTTARHRLGTFAMASSQPGAYSSEDLPFLSRVAELVGLALENALIHKELQAEKNRLRALLEVNQTLISSLDLEKFLPGVSESLRRVMNVEYASLALRDPETGEMQVYARDLPIEGIGPGTTIPAGDFPAQALEQRQVKFFRPADLQAGQSSVLRRLHEKGVRSGCCVPLITPKGAMGTLNLASTSDQAFSAPDLELLNQVAGQIAIALDNARAYREIAELKDKLSEEKSYLEDEIRSALNFEDIVGESAELNRALAQAKTVAPSDATVLILGETGTGKELIARAIHRLSARKGKSFIKLNCAAIPTGLLESELFGHERGAFTGAINQKIGRMELADSGTLFLDEVGDIPLELQPKLLRVLQDQEFERLGGTRTIRVNVRLIAATNRDLGKSVQEKEFRSDLYYRLHVFPIRVPALRERAGDIPLLVRYFVQMISRRMNKRIETIPADTMRVLSSWHWPGNVRELENFIERSVILSEGHVLNAPLSELQMAKPVSELSSKLEDLERDHILRVLRRTGGVISGPGGAAAALGLKRTTLQSRMQKLGITRRDYQS